MRRWYLPLTVLGLGGIGVFLLSHRGRAVLGELLEKFHKAPDRFRDWNDGFESELDRIQAALNQIADALDPRPELGR